MLRKLSNLFFVLFFIVFSCDETQVDNNIRVLVKGNVVDQNLNPITNAEVNVFALGGNGAVPVLLGSGLSDTDGQFSVTALFGVNERFYVNIFTDNTFTTYRYETFTEEFIPDDLVFDLQQVELRQLANLNYNITRTSGIDNNISFNFEFISPICEQVFVNGFINEFWSSCFETQNRARTLGNDNPNDENKNIQLPLNSNVIFTYRINQGAENTEIININTEENVFNFTY